MKIIYVLTILFISTTLFAQNVGIGTNNPDPSAKLHIEDNARGILIPKVNLTGYTTAAPVVSPVEGLLIYNTNTIPYQDYFL